MGGETDVTCACGHHFKTTLWQSVNVTLNPKFRQLVLDGEMNMAKCPSCGSKFHVEVPFLYHDMEGKEWIWVYPLIYEKESGTVHQKVHEMWENLKGSMPPDVRECFETEYKVIVMFGMDALLQYLRFTPVDETAQDAK